MKTMRKVLSLLLAMCMVFTLFACEKDDTNEPPKDNNATEDTPSDSKPTLSRLKKVTVTAYGEVIECNVTWEENVCHFESYMNYVKDPIENYQGVFDPENKAFSMIWDKEDGTTMEMPVFRYDDDQKIILVYNEDKPTESWEVTYDENNLPTYAGCTPFTYIPETKQVKKLYSSGHHEGVEFERYEVAMLDDNGHYVGVDLLIYEDDGTGNFQLASQKDDWKKYTYDEDGNLIRYEEPYNEDGFVIEYEYYDEPISHLWELIIPIHYIEIFDIYTVPFLWYLN